MAIYRLAIKPVGRGAGRRATAAAAYRAGERIRDERTGELFNYSRRKDVMHTEIVLPSRFAPEDAAWARDRAGLWNAAERAERRRNSRVAREYQVALPVELTPAQRLDLARNFSRELADRYNVAVDLAIHEPRAGGDPRNYHAHLLTTTREINPTGLGHKTGLDMTGTERHKRGLVSGIEELVAIRERWATLANESLEAAHVHARVDHRTLQAQGIDREPNIQVPLWAFRMERRGLRSEVAERVRESYRARVKARLQRSAEHTRIEPQPEQVDPLAIDSKSLEQIRRQAVEAWLRLRAEQPELAARTTRAQTHQHEDPGKEHQEPVSQGADDDLAL
jgi:ATP-dependent exoDNAse (exonuclease V) alpha subunit